MPRSSLSELTSREVSVDTRTIRILLRRGVRGHLTASAFQAHDGQVLGEQGAQSAGEDAYEAWRADRSDRIAYPRGDGSRL